MCLTFAVLPPPVQHQRPPAVPLTRVLDEAVALSIHISRTDFCVVNLDYKVKIVLSSVLSDIRDD